MQFFSQNLDDLAKKESSKEKILTHTQRFRFETIFPNYHEHFRPRVAAGATAQATLPPSMATNEAAAIGGGDNNLPRRNFFDRLTNIITSIFVFSFDRERRTHTFGFSINDQ